jgi:hypothetical protein
MLEQGDMEKLENQFPAVSGAAFSAAREHAFQLGYSMLQSEGGFIYEIYPHGRRILKKKIDPPTEMAPGSKFLIP